MSKLLVLLTPTMRSLMPEGIEELANWGSVSIVTFDKNGNRDGEAEGDHAYLEAPKETFQAWRKAVNDIDQPFIVGVGESPMLQDFELLY